MSIDAMKQALEALESNPDAMVDCGDGHWDFKRDLAITALRAAIEQAQEPVAHTLNCVCGAVWDVSPDGVEEMVHAPTPPPRQWQGLTEAEKNQFRQWAHPDMIEAIELRLQERNT